MRRSFYIDAIDCDTEGVGSCSFNSDWSSHCAVILVDRRAWDACAINSLPVSKISNSYWWKPGVMIAVVCFDDDSQSIVGHGLVVHIAVKVNKIYFVVKSDIRSLFRYAGRRDIWVALSRINQAWIHCYYEWRPRNLCGEWRIRICIKVSYFDSHSVSTCDCWRQLSLVKPPWLIDASSLELFGALTVGVSELNAVPIISGV